MRGLSCARHGDCQSASGVDPSQKLPRLSGLPTPRRGPFSETVPDSSHVALLGLGGATDSEIWRYALDQGFVIVSKDEDFHQRALVSGPHQKRSGAVGHVHDERHRAGDPWWPRNDHGVSRGRNRVLPHNRLKRSDGLIEPSGGSNGCNWVAIGVLAFEQKPLAVEIPGGRGGT